MLLDRVPVAAAAVFLLHLEGGRHGDKDVDRERVDVDEGVLLADLRSHAGPHSDAVVCMSRLRLPLSDRVSVSCSGCAWREEHHGDKDVDRGCVDIVDADNGLFLRSETKNTTG